MPLLSRCCCCCKLTTGALILGWLGLIYEIGSIISGYEMLSISLEEQYNNIMAAYNESSVGVYYKTLSQVDHRAPDFAMTVGLLIGWGMIMSGILGVLINVTFIYGTMKRKRILLLPWLIWVMMTIIGYVFLIVLIGLFFLTMRDTVRLGFSIYVVGFLIVALQIYSWICVQSLYRRLSQEEALNKRSRHEEIAFLPTAAYSNQPSYKYAG